MNVVSLGQAVESLRTQRGLTQKQLADQAGMSDAYISRLENGVVPNPKLGDLIALSKALDIPLQDLVLAMDPAGQDAVLQGLYDDPALTILFSQIGRGLKSKKLTDRERRLILNNLQVIADTLYADET
jgi:transcriptional regulator with XRE-family HTH domain